MSLQCPLCKEECHVKSSRYIDVSVKERYCQCKNLKCSATFRSIEQFVNFVSKPAEVQPTDEENENALKRAIQVKVKK